MRGGRLREVVAKEGSTVLSNPVAFGRQNFDSTVGPVLSGRPGDFEN